MLFVRRLYTSYELACNNEALVLQEYPLQLLYTYRGVVPLTVGGGTLTVVTYAFACERLFLESHDYWFPCQVVLYITGLSRYTNVTAPSCIRLYKRSGEHTDYVIGTHVPIHKYNKWYASE